jgi:toxin ParE1/3/4
MKLRWLRSGSEFLSRDFAFMASGNPGSGKHVRRLIRDSARHLCEFPEAGRIGLVAGTREVVVAGLPYFVVYRITYGVVEILLVMPMTMYRSSLHE